MQNNSSRILSRWDRQAYCLYIRPPQYGSRYTNACRGIPKPLILQRERITTKTITKNKLVALRFRENEYDLIKSKSDKANMNFTEFVTRSALNKQITVVDGLPKILNIVFQKPLSMNFWRQSIVSIKQRECSSNSMCNPSSRIAEQLLNQIDLETAKAFEGFEVVVATHIDRDHWHNHFVVNSVNSETGLKIQINEKGFEELRNRSDQICQQFGLEVLTPYQKPKQRSMN